jgi:hypothetical protein
MNLFSCVILHRSLTVLRLHMGDGSLLRSIYLTNAALQSVEKLLTESLTELRSCFHSDCFCCWLVSVVRETEIMHPTLMNYVFIK